MLVPNVGLSGMLGYQIHSEKITMFGGEDVDDADAEGINTFILQIGVNAFIF